MRAGGDLELHTDTKYLGMGPEGMFSMRGSSQPVFLKVNLKEKGMDTFLTSIGTVYVPRYMQQDSSMWIQDFQVSEEGNVEILWGDIHGNGEVVLERLKEVRVEKIPLTVRASTYNSEDWLRQQAARFNRENEKYQVVLEEYGVDLSWDTVTWKQNWDGYAEMTAIQMATGKGPDLLYGNVLRDYAAGLAEKGGFEDLAPYMERSGIREEDYYPLTFSGWRDGGKIYSVRTDASAREYLMDGAVLGTGREPGSMEELVDALLAWQGDEIFLERTDQAGLLELFFGGTEDMWGMIDWEQGTCDFGRNLFGKLLEVSRRYGDDGSGKRAPLAVTNYVGWNLFWFVSSSDREEEGLVKAGVLFGDGCHAVTSYYNMMMNANSTNKEGAWEFICFLLGEEAQSVCNIGLGRSPVYRAAFPVLLELRRSEKTSSMIMSKWIDGENVQVRVDYGEEELSDEEMGEYLATLEDARELPVRTRPIIEIICEEAGGYFAGSKSIEETAAIVKSKVQVYLDEVCSPQ